MSDKKTDSQMHEVHEEFLRITEALRERPTGEYFTFLAMLCAILNGFAYVSLEQLIKKSKVNDAKREYDSIYQETFERVMKEGREKWELDYKRVEEE
jgi:hypothetical protein